MVVPGANVLTRAGDKMSVEREDTLRHILYGVNLEIQQGLGAPRGSVFEEVYRRGNPPMPKASADKDHLHQRLRRTRRSAERESRRDETTVNPESHTNVLRVPSVRHMKPG